VDVNWPAFHQGNDRQGFSSVNLAPITNKTKWIFNTSGYVFSSPIIVNDVVYIGSDDKNIYAINLTTGSKIWNYTTGGAVRSTPAYYDNTIYVGSNDNKIYAVYANGSLRWNLTTGDDMDTSSPVISDSILYVGGFDGTLRAMYASSGTQIWNYTNGCGGGNKYIQNVASVIDNLIYASNNCNGLQIRNIKDGSLVTPLNGSGLSAAVDGYVIYSIDLNQVYASNRFTGAKIWNASMDENATSEGTGPAIAYGRVYVGEKFSSGTGTAKFFAFNKTTGSQIWNFTATGYESARSAPAVAAGAVYFKAENLNSPYTSAIFALNASNGNLIWTYAGGGFAPSSPAITPGSSIMVVGLNYSILAFGTIDLLPLQMNVTENLIEGQNATINVSVKNNGSLGSGFFNISLLIDNVEQSSQETELDFGMTQNYIFNWTAVVGSHNLTIAVDPDNVETDESNENNNNITTAVNVSAVPITACNLSVLIDGVSTTSFTNAGEPYNVTVNVTYTNGSAFDTTVNAIECNGLNQFALIQSIDSVFSNCDSAIVQTGSDGIISWTDVPTGGDLADSAGTYNITIKALLNGNACDEKSFTVVNRAPPTAAGQKTTNVPNRANIEGSNEQILVVFDRISRSRLSGAVAGETFDINIYDNGTAIGIPASINAGEPTGLNITVLNTSDVGIENVTVKAIEHSGLNHWALIQFDESNVSSEVTGTTHTDSNGNVRFTIVPTAGFTQQEVADAIGNYSVTLQAVLPNGTLIFNNTLTVDRTLPQPSPTEAVPNAGQIEGFNEMILVLFDRISKYI
jgi:outer membrane protein assembly factor BamB